MYILYVEIKIRVYIELPTEDAANVNGKTVGKLEKALCGTHDAPQAWRDESSRDIGGYRVHDECSLPRSHERLKVAMVAHVDDLLCSGPAVSLEWVRAELSNMYEVKGEVMAEGDSEIKFLGRTTGRNVHGFYLLGGRPQALEHLTGGMGPWSFALEFPIPAAAEYCLEHKVEDAGFGGRRHTEGVPPA